LQLYSDYNLPESPSLMISKIIRGLLGITYGDPKNENWIDFLLGSENIKGELQCDQIYDLKEEKAMEALDQSLQSILEESKNLAQTQDISKEVAFSTFTSKCLNQLKQQMSALLISQLFILAETQEENELKVSEYLLRLFEQKFELYLKEFSNYYKSLHQEEDITEDEGNALQVAKDYIIPNEDLDEEDEDEERNDLSFVLITPMKMLNELRMNMAYYFFYEFMYQFLFAQAANPSEYEMIEQRISHLYGITNRIILVSETNISRESLDSRIEELYKMAFQSDQTSSKTAFYSKICGNLIPQVKHVFGTNESILFAKRLLLARVDLLPSGSNFLPKHTMDASMYADLDELDPISVLKGFDLLIEYDSSYYEAYNNLFRDFWKYIPLVIESKNQNMYENMMMSRRYFQEKLISDSPEFYKELYQHILFTVSKNPQEVVENFGLALNREIDQLGSTKSVEQLEFSEFYWPMKIHIANLADPQHWKMSIRKLQQKDLEKNALVIDKSAVMKRALDQALEQAGKKEIESKSIEEKLSLFEDQELVDAFDFKISNRALI